MFHGKSLWMVIHQGGFVMYILVLCSMISIAVILERVIYYKRRSQIKRAEFMKQIKKELEKNYTKKALELCKEMDTPFSCVVHAGLTLHGHSERIISEAMERETVIETIKLERFTSIVATIGSTAVYIGLLGTIFGIIHAFQDIFEKGTGGVTVVINGISEALVCTAAGLIVAIPAVIAYNFFIRKIDNFVADMELCASELIDVICIPKM
jgi:biopolymer transport protein ExbB